MALSPYIRLLRSTFGHQRLLLPSVTGIVRDSRGAVLLVRSRDDELWSTPGGTIELDEIPAEAVQREIFEETGMRVQAVRLVGVYGGPEFVVRYPNGDETQYISSMFECVVLAGAPKPDHDEINDARFFTRDEANQLNLAPWLKRVLPVLYRPDLAGWFEGMEGGEMGDDGR